MNRRERKKEQTKENIIQCAIELFMNKGFNETSMEEIAEKADISKGTLYNYFRDKEAILGAYFKSNIANYRDGFKESIKECKGIENQLEKIIDFMNALLQSNVELSEAYLSYRVKTIFSDKVFNESSRSGLEGLILQVIKEGRENKELRNDIPLIIMARNLMFLYMNFFVSSVYGKEHFEVEHIKSQLIELFLNGARN